MIVIHRAFGYRFVIYTQDHQPAHVHITGPGQAKIEIRTASGRLELVYSVGIKLADMRRLMREVENRQAEFLAEWERIHGQSD